MWRNQDWGCSQHGHHVTGDIETHRWGHCCMPGHERRHFHTREEVIAELEEYLKDLHAEIKGVEEHIAELKKEA